MFTVQFKDGDWHEHAKFNTKEAAEKEMKRGIRSDSTGPWRVIDKDKKVVWQWPN